jgi:Transglycosylase SLT domain
VLRSIGSASRRTGIDFTYLLNQARTESAFNPAAKAPTSSAAGLFQFTSQTWLATLDAHGAEHGLAWAADAIRKGPDGSYTVADAAERQAILDLRHDPDAASAMAAELAADNGDFLSGALGREASTTDLSLAHFLGADGAAKFLTAMGQNADASAAPFFPEAAKANRAVFFQRDGTPRTLGEIHARFASQGAAGGSSPPSFEPQRPTVIVRQAFASDVRSSGEPAAFRPIEQMPGHLSLEFAQAAYRRLSSLGDGA